MNVEQTIKTLYEKYHFFRNGYIEKDEQLQKMSASDINRKNVFNAFEIYNAQLNKHKKSCTFIDGIVNKTVISIRSTCNIFINVIFKESKFDSCSFTETVFINCLFEDIDFKISGLHNTIFLNCEFEECRMNDLDMEDIYFINTDPTQIINVLTEDSFIIENSDIHIIEDKTVFGIFSSIDKCAAKKIEEKFIEKDIAEEKEGDKEIMDKHNNQKFIQSEVTLTDSYYNCEFNDITFSQEITQDTYFQNCKFINCVFVDVKFRGVILDGSRFEKCHFEQVIMNRCSLIDVTVDKDTILGVEFISCHTFNMQLKCELIRSSFNHTYNPNEFNKEIKKDRNEEIDNVNYNSVLLQLESIIKQMKTEEYKTSIENKKKITEEEVYGYLKNKSMPEVMVMLSKITASFSNVEDEKNDVM